MTSMVAKMETAVTITATMRIIAAAATRDP